MPTHAPSGSHHHKIYYLGHGAYRISWRYDVKYGRLLGSRCISRDTDRKGAQRFAKKWHVQLPEDKPPVSAAAEPRAHRRASKAARSEGRRDTRPDRTLRITDSKP